MGWIHIYIYSHENLPTIVPSTTDLIEVARTHINARVNHAHDVSYPSEVVISQGGESEVARVGETTRPPIMYSYLNVRVTIYSDTG